MTTESVPFVRVDDGVRIAVRLTPRAGRDAIGGTVIGADGRPALAVRLAAPPVEGAANKALIAFLAKTFGVPKTGVRILSGETARLKIVLLSGDPDVIVARLSARLGGED